jgi:protein-disulfide isomerase
MTRAATIARFLPALALALAGCSGGADGNASAAAPAAPVQGKAAPAGQSWTEVVSKTDEGYRMGNPDAPVKLVEYGSRLCPACRAFATEGFAPVQQYVTTGKVSFEFREFLVHGAADVPPALLGRCAGEGPFFAILEQQYKDQPAFVEKLTEPFMRSIQGLPPQQAFSAMADQMGLVTWMKQRGLPEPRARQCLADSKQVDQLTKQTQDRGADGTVSGTPTLMVNGRKVEGIGWGEVDKALKAAGA